MVELRFQVKLKALRFYKYHPIRVAAECRAILQWGSNYVPQGTLYIFKEHEYRISKVDKNRSR